MGGLHKTPHALNGYRSAGYNVGKVKRQMLLLVE